MKILYIGPYRQNEEWGIYSRNFIQSLIRSKNEIAIRPVYMHTSSLPNISEDLLELENKKLDYDCVIQHCLPTLFEYDGRYKNIGMFQQEAGNNEYWKNCATLMDENWLPSMVDVANVGLGNVIMPIPIDTSIFEKSHSHIHLGTYDKTFKFYFIGEYNQRKNLKALIQAFHLEFHPSEPVDLVLKVHHPSYGPDQLFDIVRKDIEAIKQELRTYPNSDCFKKDFIITQPLNEAELLALHNTCNCFVLPSHGESVSLDCLTALGMGKTPIITSCIGPFDYIDGGTGFVVDSIDTHCIMREPPLPNIYTGFEYWREISLSNLMEKMREAYEQPKGLRKKMQANGLAKVYDYSFESVAEIINANTN